jgi:hypothetical protein
MRRKNRLLIETAIGLSITLGLVGAILFALVPPTTTGAHAHQLSTRAQKAALPLRPGETVIATGMKAPYTPKSRNTALDDYRCFIVDPGITQDTFLTGVKFAPGNLKNVHHIILFPLDSAMVAGARAKDATEKGPGWQCFGGPGVATTAQGTAASLIGSPWLAAWAPGGDEHVIPDGLGVPMAAGAQMVMQVHYNLRAGKAPDVSKLDLRTMPATANLKPLSTRLLVSSVEIPCQPGEVGPLCDRTAAVNDVAKRFGQESRLFAEGLQLICGTQAANGGPGTASTCDWPVMQSGVIYAAAPHMHQLGSAMKITLNPGTAREQTVLDVPLYDFDRQSAQWLANPVKIAPGDRFRITCSWRPELRKMLPIFKGTEPRYVVWGEGTTDEMCLGVLSVGRN